MFRVLAAMHEQLSNEQKRPTSVACAKHPGLVRDWQNEVSWGLRACVTLLSYDAYAAAGLNRK